MQNEEAEPPQGAGLLFFVCAAADIMAQEKFYGNAGGFLRRIFCFAATIAVCVQSFAANTTLKLGSTPWPPFTGKAGEPRIVIDLVNEALRRIRVFETVTIVTDGTLTQQIKDGNFDGSPALWRDTDRETYLEYSAPLLENRLVLVGKRGSDVRAKSLTELKGKRVGIVTGYSYGEEMKKAKDTQFVAGADQQTNLDKMMRGELDYILIDDLLLQYLLKNQGGETKAKLEIGRTPLVRRLLYFALRKNVPNATKILTDFNAELKQMLSDGTYNQMLQMDWIRADVDGDGKMELIPRTRHIGTAPPSNEYSIFYDGDEPNAPGQRYWVNGQVYSDWERVPAQYRVDELARREPSKPLFQLKF